LSTNGAATEFRHDALLYSGEEQFLDGALPFIHAGLAQDDHVLVVLDDAKVALVRSKLGRDADEVQFADMRDIGANPARLIPAWRQYIDAHGASGRNIRGLGEPIWEGRSGAELAECQRHEALLNLASADVSGLSLLCPYETGALGEDVVAGACRSHAAIVECGSRRPSHSYRGDDAASAPFDDPLAAPRAPARELAFGAADLAALRRLVAGRARAAGLDAVRGEDIVLAVNEIATNSIRHGGGRGTLRVWQEDAALICEVRDSGHLDDPLAGRRRPSSSDCGGRGLWLANQVCDLVQLRSFAHGTVVRLHVRVR
jgi:anti-sigma regulatory factor (Ser/Thr protein kinase)